MLVELSRHSPELHVMLLVLNIDVPFFLVGLADVYK